MMKNKIITLTFIFISLSVACFAQSALKTSANTHSFKGNTGTAIKSTDTKSDPLHFKIELSELEQMTIADYQEWEKQTKIKVDLFNQEMAVRREEYQKFLRRLFDSRKIPTDRLSEKGDSLKFNTSEITGILKPLKPK